MKPVAISGVALLGVLLASHSAVGATVLTSVGVYDPVSNPNAVDSTATGSSETVAVFTPLVLTAFNANFGGVIDFDIGGTIAANDTVFDLRYGASAGKNLRVTTDVTISVVPNVNPTTGSISALSGSGVLTNQTSGDGDIRFTLGPITAVAGGGVIADEFVTALGFTLLSRNNYPNPAGRTFTITATFSDTSTSVVTTNISSVKGADDTFVSFAAPAGLSISSVLIDSDQVANTNTPAFDDFAFRTSVIPEPGSAALLLGGAGLLLRRRTPH